MPVGPMISIETVVPPVDEDIPSPISAAYQSKMVSVSARDVGAISAGIAEMLISLKEARSIVEVVKVVPKWIRKDPTDTRIHNNQNNFQLVFLAHAVLTGVTGEKVKTASVQCSLENDPAGAILANAIYGNIVSAIASQATQTQELARKYGHLFSRAT